MNKAKTSKIAAEAVVAAKRRAYSALSLVLVGAYYGVDLSGLVGGSSSMGIPTQQATRLDSQQEAELNELSRVVLADTEKAWSKYFQQHSQRYTPTTMVLYEGGTSTACGMGQSAMGPFYCPGDKKFIWI